MATDDEVARRLHDAAPPTARGVDFGAVRRGAVRRRRTQSLAGGVAALVLVLGGGAAVASGLLGPDETAGLDTARVLPQPSTSLLAPSTASSVPSTGQTAVAVPTVQLLTSLTGPPALVSVAPDGQTTSRVLPGPGDGRTNGTDATLSGGVNALACVIWSGTGPSLDNEVRCYPGGRGPGRAVEGIGPGVRLVALRADAKMLAWVADRPAPYGAADVYVARFDGRRVTDVRRSEPEPGQRYPGGLPIGPGKITWAGDDALLLSLVADGDEGSGLVRLPLTELTSGWLHRPRIAPGKASGYDFYALAGSSDGATALALEVAACCTDTARTPSRAVRLDLTSGRVLEVIATAAAGRELLSVVSDNRTVVYATVAGGPETAKFYLRRPGADRVTLTGLSGTPVGLAS